MKISLEELEALATSPTPEDEIVLESLDEAQKFALANDIKRGDTWVTATNIYDRYKKWRHGKGVPKKTFFLQFHKYFERKRDGRATYYKLNPEGFDFSIEHYFYLRAQVRAQKEMTRKKLEVKKKNSEKSKKASSINKKV